jgi:drug/metabolite transporter (DMT)-like permease
VPDTGFTDRRRKEQSRARLLAAFAAVYLVWGSTYLFIRFAVETLPPFLMAGVRFAVAGAIL